MKQIAFAIILVALVPCALLVGCGGSDFTSGFEHLADAGTDAHRCPDGPLPLVIEGCNSPDGSGGSAGSDAGGAAGAAGAAPEAGAGGAPSCFKIDVQSAVYAANCGAPTSMPTIAAECDAKFNCTYVVDTGNKDPKGDPAPGCWKDLTVEYNCMGETGVESQKTSYTTMVHDNTEVRLECCPP